MDNTVSVIIPVYNAQETIRRCAESILYGLFRDVEVILVDDCSSDQSWLICQELKDEFENVNIIKNNKNSGVSYTRNQGLNLATGKYIAFVDSDDWVSKNYIQDLYGLAVDYPDRLPVCGMRFIDRVNGIRQNYCGNKDSGVTLKDRCDFFDLVDDFLIQSIWNKMYCADVIRDHHLQFDISQSMGEDFQFVLNYIEAAQMKGAVILHKPLYYYIRQHSNSLISNYGFIQNDDEKDRIRQLYRITGLNNSEKMDDMLEKIRKNHIYHIVRNKTHTKKEKLEVIRKVGFTEDAEKEYQKQTILKMKEALWMVSKTGSKNLIRIRDRIRRDAQNVRLKKIKNQANLSDLTILSQNCIGGVFYHDMGLQFSSPTVNLFFSAEDFVKFVLNLKYYLSLSFQWKWDEEYPIGMLDDIEIHFMHYNNCKEAEDSWNRRCQRILDEKILVLSTDRENFDRDVFAEWKKIPYPKLLFTAKEEFSSDPDSLYYPEYQDQGFVGDLISDRSFYKENRITEKCREILNL